jgi:hypothetical protein
VVERRVSGRDPGAHVAVEARRHLARTVPLPGPRIMNRSLGRKIFGQIFNLKFSDKVPFPKQNNKINLTD